MADRKDLEFTYNQIDRIFRLSLGELADFSGAKYDGDFSMSLEEAQQRKKDYVAEQIGIEPGKRVLDLGCGWGALLDSVRSRGAKGVGITMSDAQVEACRSHGLDVHLLDARELTEGSFGQFDAVASLGSFEHFCSRRTTRPGGRRTSTATSSPASRASCPTAAGSMSRRWCSAATCSRRKRSRSTPRATPTRGTWP